MSLFEGGWACEKAQGKNVDRPSVIRTCTTCQCPEWIWGSVLVSCVMCEQCSFELAAFGKISGIGSGRLEEVTQQIADVIKERAFFG